MLSCLVIWLLCSLLHLSVGTNSSDEDKIPLRFAYITTKTGELVVSGGIPIVDWSLEMINERDDILQNYTLNYTNIRDSKVNTKSEYFLGTISIIYIYILYIYNYI